MALSEGPMLARATYDRATQHRTDEAWLAQAWTTARLLLVSPKSSTPITRVDGAPCIAFRRSEDVAPDATRRFLGLVGDIAYFSVAAEVDDGEWAGLREIGQRADELEAGLLTSAIALEQWHLRHTHCPQCGHPTVEAQGGWVRTCPNDASVHFPRTDPAVIMLIHDGGDLALLGRGPQWGQGRFSTLAGFVEPGESLEAAVAREVFEEVGVLITDVRYVASQPWPFPASLMLGFTARLDGDPTIHLDPVEMAEAGWFTRAEIRAAADWTDDEEPAPDPGRRLQAIPPRFSISRYLIDGWLAADS
jgi:NAD+ diphosphatase